MKNLRFFLLYTLLFGAQILPQIPRTFGPVFDYEYDAWIKQPNGTPYAWSNSHKVGVIFYNGPAWEIRNISYWKWTYSDIPTQATVTSVTLSFQAWKGNDKNHSLHFSLHSIPYPFNTTGVNYWDECNNTTKVYETTLQPANHVVTFEETFTSGELFNAVKAAVESGNYFFTLGLMELTPSLIPYWEISALGGSVNASSSPAIRLTINYNTYNTAHVFRNVIGQSNTYGNLILNNDKVNPVASNSSRDLMLTSWNSIRTNETPFCPNWNSSGISYKHQYFDGTNTARRDSLLHIFQVTSTDEIFKNARFASTSFATINSHSAELNSNLAAGQVQFKDPWHYYKDNSDDWYQSNTFISHDLPFILNNSSPNDYGGVFLDQSITGTHYAVKYINAQSGFLTQTQKNHRFYFLDWSTIGANLAADQIETPVEFTYSNSQITANVKGTQLTNIKKALSTNSQNKIVRTASGNLFQVYESLGHIWCEKSTDDGDTWDLFGSIPFNGNDSAKHPSIAWFEDISESRNLLGITYQLKTSTGSVIYAVFYDESGEYQFSGQISSNTVSWGTNAHPVIAIGSYSPGIDKRTGMIVWENSGLRFSYFSLYGGINLLQQDVAVSGAGSSSINPSISVRSGENSNFQLAWESSANIYYNYASPTGNMVTWGTAENISDGCGYTENFTPSIVSFNQSVNKGSRVCWVGRKIVDENTEEEGEGGIGLPKTSAEFGNEERRVIFHDPENSSAYWHFGYNVRPPVINKSTNSYGTDMNYAFAWTVGNSSYFADNTLSDIWPISTFADSGICLSNGFASSDLSDMYASIQNTASQPYYFQTTDNLQEYVNEGISKTKQITIASGREGIIRKGGAHFYYCLGDILLDENKVKFVDYPQSLKLSSLEQLNQYTASARMNVTDQTILDYSVMYGVLDTAAAALAFTGDENIRFRVVLLDAGTNEVLGEYDNVVYSRQSRARYRNLAYRLSMQGIGNRSVRLALKIDANGPVGFSLATKLAIDNVLTKRGGARKEVAFAETTVKDYQLSQNYPNPFNSVTTIRYALPKDGIATLKVYDILGKEIRTLVNEGKTAGRYTVSFNASSLPSGTYFYELRAGDYRAVKKMIILK